MKLNTKFALFALMATLIVGVSGCKEPTFKNVYSTSDEIQMGQEASDEIDASEKIDMNVQDNTRVQNVAQPIFDQARKIRPDLPYQIRIIDSPEINAFSLPGGFIYIYTGLLNKLGNDDDALAGVIGHETAHAVRRHVVKQMSDAGGKGILLQLFGMSTNSYDAYNYANLAYDLDQLHFSRQDEYEADKYGLMFAYNAGYDPAGMNRMFKKLEDLEKITGSEPAYAEDHPITKNRELRVVDLEKELQANDGTYPDSSTPDTKTSNGAAQPAAGAKNSVPAEGSTTNVQSSNSSATPTPAPVVVPAPASVNGSKAGVAAPVAAPIGSAQNNASNQ